MKRFHIKYLLKILLIVCISIFFYQIFVVHAQVTLPIQYKPQYAPDVPVKVSGANTGADFVNFLLQLIANALIGIAAPIAILIIAIAGLLAVISHGNTALQGKVKKTISGAVIGLVIIILSWAIIQAIISFALQATGNINATPTQTQTQSTSTTQNGPGSGGSGNTIPGSTP